MHFWKTAIIFVYFIAELISVFRKECVKRIKSSDKIQVNIHA